MIKNMLKGKTRFDAPLQKLKPRMMIVLSNAKKAITNVVKLPIYIRIPILAILLLASILLGIQYRHTQLYIVSVASRQLLTKSSIDTTKLKVTPKTISYNESDQKPTGDKNVTIAGPTDATGKTGYQATINTDFKQGLRFGDSSSELSFTMTPLFKASKAQYQNGQVLFPVSNSTKIFQTFKKNGIKEDIILTKAPAKTASWQWQLNLGDKLSAKIMPDGSVGVFAASPNLYGDITISDAKSQALIDKARTIDKTYQIFAIPAPYIKNAKGQTLKEDVNYKLAGNTLTLEARNLENQHYPISIDPSAVVTTTADFLTGSDDGMIDYATADQIGRSAVSLGTTGTYTSNTNYFSIPRYGHTSVAYNGYLYVIGGYEATSDTNCKNAGTSNYCNDIQYAAINSNGSIGSFTTNTNYFSIPRNYHTSVAYNGYLYVIGGQQANSDTNCKNAGTSSECNDIQYSTLQAPAQAAHYERVVDIGRTADTVDSIQYNGTANCGAEVQYATAGSGGTFGSLTTLMPDAIPGTTYNISGHTLKRYVRVVITLNDQSCGGNSSISDITVNYTLLPPAAPTLSAPASGAVNVSLTPVFQLKTTDALDAYAQYKILVYQSDCSTLIRTIDQTSSQTGWSGQDAQTSTAYVMGTTLGASTLASHTYQAAGLSYNTTYCWKAAAIDPGGSNTFGSYSVTQLFSTNFTPTVPTLVQPSSSQTGVSTLPEFRLYSTDQDSDYIRYKIDVCSTSNCSSIVRTIDQTSSQTGWASQSQQGATAYSSGQTAVHTYQAAALAANTQYWWRAYAIDPAGVNAFSAASSIGTFNTTPATQTNVNIGSGTTIYGGTTIGQ